MQVACKRETQYSKRRHPLRIVCALLQAVTIDDIVCVINSGRHKEKSYDPYTNVSTLQAQWIPRASERQRRGRAGRCQQVTPSAFHARRAMLRYCCLLVEVGRSSCHAIQQAMQAAPVCEGQWLLSVKDLNGLGLGMLVCEWLAAVIQGICSCRACASTCTPRRAAAAWQSISCRSCRGRLWMSSACRWCIYTPIVLLQHCAMAQAPASYPMVLFWHFQCCSDFHTLV